MGANATLINFKLTFTFTMHLFQTTISELIALQSYIYHTLHSFYIRDNSPAFLTSRADRQHNRRNVSASLACAAIQHHHKISLHMTTDEYREIKQKVNPVKPLQLPDAATA